MPRRFASSAASKASVGASPLVAPAILKESLSKLEKLDDEDDSIIKSEETQDGNEASEGTQKCISLPAETGVTSNDKHKEEKCVEIKANESDNESQDDIKWEQK